MPIAISNGANRPIRVGPNGHDGDAVVGLAGQQASKEGYGSGDVVAGMDRMWKFADQVVGVAVWRCIGIAVGDRTQRDIGMAVRGVDRIHCRHRKRVLDVRHDAEYPDLSTLGEHIGHADGGGIVPPQGQIGIDDDARGVGVYRRTLCGRRGRNGCGDCEHETQGRTHRQRSSPDHRHRPPSERCGIGRSPSRLGPFCPADRQRGLGVERSPSACSALKGRTEPLGERRSQPAECDAGLDCTMAAPWNPEAPEKPSGGVPAPERFSERETIQREDGLRFRVGPAPGPRLKPRTRCEC